MQRLEGKIAIVTGGAGGIGAAVVKRMIDEGAKVAVADISEARAREVADAHGKKAIAIRLDAGDEKSIKEMVEQTIRHFGQLDILHNNAALTDFEVISRDTTAVDTSMEIWNRTLNVNTTGYMLGCKYALPHMISRGSGVIINTASDAGYAGELVRIAYGTSKAAVMALTKYVATQHGRQGIRCNAIAPGIILTRGLIDSAPGIVGLFERHHLTPRFGQPEDIAALAAFLASEDSGYITGQTISCDGGILVHGPHYGDVAGGWPKSADQ